MQKIVLYNSSIPYALSPSCLRKYFSLKSKSEKCHAQSSIEYCEYGDVPEIDISIARKITSIIERDDPCLVEAVEDFLNSTNADSVLRIVELPDGIKWGIVSIDDKEHVYIKN